MLFGIAIKACVILYIMINLVLRRHSTKVGQPRVSRIKDLECQDKRLVKLVKHDIIREFGHPFSISKYISCQ